MTLGPKRAQMCARRWTITTTATSENISQQVKTIPQAMALPAQKFIVPKQTSEDSEAANK